MRTSNRIKLLTGSLIIGSILLGKNVGLAQSSAKFNGNRFHMGLVGQMGIPMGQFKEYANPQGGVRFEVGYAIFKAVPSITIGGELSGTFTGAKKDIYKGAEIKTSSSLVHLYPMLRWAPKTKKRIAFYVDAAAGYTGAGTETTSTIVDKATFLEQILGSQPDDIVETVTHKNASFNGFGYSIGAGINFRPCISIGVRYHHINNIKYANKDEVSVVNTEIIYVYREIPIDMIVVTLGVSSWGLY
jgi:opacity protein-like surface antigen